MIPEIYPMKLHGIVTVCAFSSTVALAQFPPQIKNVVVIVQENRTPDNLFHYLAPACPIPPNAAGLDACTPAPVTSSCYNIAPCGVSNQSGAPRPVTLKPARLYGSAQPQHSHWSFEKMCDPDPATLECRNDGAWRITVPHGGSYAYVLNTGVTNFDGSKGHLLDPYLTFARDYGWANYMFQSNQGPSYAAHQYLFSGTAGATAEDDAKSTFVAEDFNTNSQTGCLAPKAATNNILSPALSSPPRGCSVFDDRSVQECTAANIALIYPINPVGSFCESHQTMADVLDPHKISWEYYAATAGALATAPVAFKQICEPQFVNPNGDPTSALTCTGKEWNANVDISNLGTDILNDIANCTLSQVSWVTPDDKWSDHAGGNDLYGPSWVTAIVNGIGTQKTCPAGTKDAGQNYWENTAIIVTWDDWGGWTDHEIPRLASNLPCKSTDCRGDYEHGFRVPMIVISAYTSAGFISNGQHDFGSILRMIEGVNHLTEGQLGFADARATTDLREFFPLRVPRPYHVVPAQKDASFFLSIKGAAGIDPDDD
jgi:phospholipase C